MSPLYIWWVPFDSTISTAWAILHVIVGILFSLALITTRWQWRRLVSFGLTFVGVTSFELLTWSLWKIQYLWSRAYSFRDISWLLSLLRTSLIVLVDHVIWHHKWHHASKIVTIAWLFALFVYYLNATWIITYEYEAQNAIIAMIWPVPLNILYYIPLWVLAVYGFKKYFDLWLFHKYEWSFTLPTFKALLIAFFAVLGGQFLLEPVVQYTSLPQFWYIYKDIHIFITLIWVVIFVVVNLLVNTIFKKLPLFSRYWYAVFFASLLGGTMHSYLIKHNILSFSMSALATHTKNSIYIGDTWLTSMTLVSTILFVSLMIASIKFWTQKNI